MNKRKQYIYILDQGYGEDTHLVSCVQDCPGIEIHFISPFQLTSALGPTYWQGPLKNLKDHFPLKKIYVWHEYLEAPGLTVGALRMGIRHIIYKGQSEHLQKIKTLAEFYQARVISSEQEI